MIYKDIKQLRWLRLRLPCTCLKGRCLARDGHYCGENCRCAYIWVESFLMSCLWYAYLFFSILVMKFFDSSHLLLCTFPLVREATPLPVLHLTMTPACFNCQGFIINIFSCFSLFSFTLFSSFVVHPAQHAELRFWQILNIAFLLRNI